MSLMGNEEKFSADIENKNLSSEWIDLIPSIIGFENFNCYGFRFDKDSFGEDAITKIHSIAIRQNHNEAVSGNATLSVVAIKKDDTSFETKFQIAKSNNKITAVDSNKGEFLTWNFDEFTLSDDYFYYAWIVNDNGNVYGGKFPTAGIKTASKSGDWNGAFMGMWGGEYGNTNDMHSPQVKINTSARSAALAGRATVAETADLATKISTSSIATSSLYWTMSSVISLEANTSSDIIVDMNEKISSQTILNLSGWKIKTNTDYLTINYAVYNCIDKKIYLKATNTGDGKYSSDVIFYFTNIVA